MTYDDTKTIIDACVRMIALAYVITGAENSDAVARSVVADLDKFSDETKGPKAFVLATCDLAKEILA